MNETGLVRYDAMCKAIAECHHVDEVVNIRHKAKAFEVYAKQALNTEAERKAIEVRLRAERKAGELLKEMKKDGQRAAPKDGPSSRDGRLDKPALKDLGITKDQSSTWQKLAEVPQEDFEVAMSAPEKPSTEKIIAAAAPKIHLDVDSLWAYSRIRDFEKIMKRPASELYGLMQDFQQTDLREILPRLISWLGEMK